ncbi:class I glutamine amidotransferase-like protein [Aspergillus cavernicola]|uniref:Class I glutamine amidotransferase-like protein n=1 Tax=Aspergillus cavernicola TaxID=176166 RepID=A0ABR4HVV0_9EURO
MEPLCPRLRAAFLIFNGLDVLYFAGPLEIFSHVHHGMDYTAPNPAFELTVIGRSHMIPTSAAIKITPDISIADARSRIKEFDILVVPGGPPPFIYSLIETHSEELQLVKDFGLLEHIERRKPRAIISICTGAQFLGAAGLLNGIRATTHHLFLEPTVNI